jgi:phenylacetate-CoA ligase
MLESRSHITLQAWQNFLTTPLSAILEHKLQPNSETLILERFREVVTTVPAYQIFLQQQGVEPKLIATLTLNR